MPMSVPYLHLLLLRIIIKDRAATPGCGTENEQHLPLGEISQVRLEQKGLKSGAYPFPVILLGLNATMPGLMRSLSVHFLNYYYAVSSNSYS